MGWFDEQIRQRAAQDQQAFEESFLNAAEAVVGKKAAEEPDRPRILTRQAIEDVLRFFRLKPVEIPDFVCEPEARIDACLRPHGIMRRPIELEAHWYRDSYGPVLAYLKKDGTSVALLPGKIRGYSYLDPATGKKVRLNAQTAAFFQREAYCFYKPLPQRKLGAWDLIRYMKDCLSLLDVAVSVFAALAAVWIGTLLPRIVGALTGPLLQSGNASALANATVCGVCVILASGLVASVSKLLTQRIEIKTSVGVQSALLMRILSLPAPFFRQYGAGDLSMRMETVNRLCRLLIGMVFSSGLGALSSLLYLTQIFRFAPALFLPVLLTVLLSAVLTLASSLMQARVSRRKMAGAAKQSGLGYALISGVQKIRLAGAEKRVFARWLNLYAEEAAHTYNPPLFLKLNGMLNLAVPLVASVVLYVLAAKSGVSSAGYLAFNAAYGCLMGAFSALAGVALQAADIRPTLEMAAPFWQTEPETAENKEIVTALSGEIELHNICFRYGENMPFVLDHVSLEIKSGEYVALVGRTGCGKSTLMRLLMGFEKPALGTISYDGKNLSDLDLPSLRLKIGAVMQDGALLQGDLYSNIVFSAPELTLDDAWEAAEIAGIADDIRALPMGMHTVVSEGQCGLSGGQKQRLMIARAIAPKPKILLLDEATSALDNLTQKRVSEALDKMDCTRIVIAHRLSTIQHCNRILVLDHGKIVEDGTYDTLIARGGFFTELVRRQQANDAGEF